MADRDCSGQIIMVVEDLNMLKMSTNALKLGTVRDRSVHNGIKGKILSFWRKNYFHDVDGHLSNQNVGKNSALFNILIVIL